MRNLSNVLLVLSLLALSAGAQPALQAFAATTTTTTSASSIPAAINPVNPAAIPLGDGNVSTSAKAGYVYSCITNFSGQGGAFAVGPWINTAAKTWNSETKVAVEGSVSWPGASYNVKTSGNERIITGNDEPVDHTTGTFPISSSDPAYSYDRNPNHIAAQNVDIVMPLNPTVAATPTCLPGGPVGILDDGVYLYDALDGEGRDAAAHEVLDNCEGHPDQSSEYHHHDVPSCILSQATGNDTSTLVGYALDGFGIYVERDGSGNLLTNANLDACHGRTSEVMWNGQMTEIYHYDATLEYPYTVGCFMGNPGAPTGGSTSTTSSSTTTTSSSSTPPTSSTTSSQATSTTSSTSSTTQATSTTSSTSSQTSSSTSQTTSSPTTTASTTTNNTPAPEFSFPSLAALYVLIVVLVTLVARKVVSPGSFTRRPPG